MIRNSAIFMVDEDGEDRRVREEKDVDLNILVRAILFIYKW